MSPYVYIISLLSAVTVRVAGTPTARYHLESYNGYLLKCGIQSCRMLKGIVTCCNLYQCLYLDHPSHPLPNKFYPCASAQVSDIFILNV
jgi:hypothetical protein